MPTFKLVEIYILYWLYSCFSLELSFLLILIHVIVNYIRNADMFLQSVLSGYNGTIMAYGQTGTGKTYTVGTLGKDDVSEHGIMIRSVEDIIANTSASDSIEVSYLQVSNMNQGS